MSTIEQWPAAEGWSSLESSLGRAAIYVPENFPEGERPIGFMGGLGTSMDSITQFIRSVGELNEQEIPPLVGLYVDFQGVGHEDLARTAVEATAACVRGVNEHLDLPSTDPITGLGISLGAGTIAKAAEYTTELFDDIDLYGPAATTPQHLRALAEERLENLANILRKRGKEPDLQEPPDPGRELGRLLHAEVRRRREPGQPKERAKSAEDASDFVAQLDRVAGEDLGLILAHRRDLKLKHPDGRGYETRVILPSRDTVFVLKYAVQTLKRYGLGYEVVDDDHPTLSSPANVQRLREIIKDRVASRHAASVNTAI